MQSNHDAATGSSTHAAFFVLPDSGEAMLTVQHVASALGRSVSTVWELTKNDPDFPQPVRDGERYTRFRLSDVRTYVASLTSGVAKQSPAQRRRGGAQCGGAVA